MPVERIVPSATFLDFHWDSVLTANTTILSHSKVTLLLFFLSLLFLCNYHHSSLSALLIYTSV